MDSPSQVAQFRFGMSDDGSRCQLVFIDEKQRVMRCVATFSELTSFITRLCEAASEMVKRQDPDHDASAPGTESTRCQPIDVSSAAFRVNPADGSIIGALVSNAGEVVGLRMRPEIASQLTRDLLMAAPASRA